MSSSTIFPDSKIIKPASEYIVGDNDLLYIPSLPDSYFFDTSYIDIKKILFPNYVNSKPELHENYFSSNKNKLIKSRNEEIKKTSLRPRISVQSTQKLRKFIKLETLDGINKTFP